MNQVKITGSIAREVYNGNAKSGPYTAGNVEVKDGKYSFWLGFYCPGTDLSNAQIGQSFNMEGSLTENKREKDGQTVRTIQLKVSRAVPVTNANGRNPEITDDEIF